MYKIKIALKVADNSLLELKTESRNLARAAKELCTENKLACEVTAEVAEREVKFKGLD